MKSSTPIQTNDEFKGICEKVYNINHKQCRDTRHYAMFLKIKGDINQSKGCIW